MSELKAISGLEIREDIDYNTRGIDPEDKEWRNYGKELCDTLYYRKSEADKVIAELKKENEEQKRLRDMALASVPNVLKVMKIIQHHKYKRCLAMAHGCKYLCAHYQFREVYKKRDFFRKWMFRWFELAEKFKEAK